MKISNKPAVDASSTPVKKSQKLKNKENMSPITKKTLEVAKNIKDPVPVDAPKKDLRRYFDTFLKLLHPVPEGILGEVIPQIMDDKKLSPYFSDILVSLGCEDEKVVIEKLVQWLNSKPTKAGTLALVEKLPSEAIRTDLARFTETYGDDRTQMNRKFRDILSTVGSEVFDKLFQERQKAATT